MFGHEMRGRTRRLAELAGMCKEKGQGTIGDLEEIKAKFAIKKGLTEEVTDEYTTLLIKSKLLIFTYGQETWKYDPENEMEIFNVNL